MKKIILSAIALLPLSVMAQHTFTIDGHIKNIKTGDKVFLVYYNGTKNAVDSSLVTDGNFKLSGELADPSKGNIFLHKNPYVNRPVQGEKMDFITLYLEAGKIKVDAVDSLKYSTVTGSKLNDDNARLQAKLKPINAQLAVLNRDYDLLSPEDRKDRTKIDALEKQFNIIKESQMPVYINFAKENPKSFVSLASVAEAAKDEKMVDEAGKAYMGLSPELKATQVGLKMGKFFTEAGKTAVGATAIDFTQNDVNDKPVKLSDFKGKYVLLDFWASWCGPCRLENPFVVAAYNKFKDKGFTVLSVSLDRPGKKEDWKTAIENDKLTWTQVSDLTFWDNKVAKAYGVTAIPANFLIDPNGKIVAKGLRREALEAKLAELLK